MADDNIPVRSRARPKPARAIRLDEPLPPASAGEEDAFDLTDERPLGGAIPTDLRQRVRHVSQFNREYTREFVFETLHELLLAGVPMDQIAQRFGVSLRTVYTWKAQLRDAFRDEIRSLDPLPLYGKTLKHFQAIQTAAWRLHNRADAKPHEKARALDVALSSQTEQIKFFKIAGLFDVAKLSLPKDATQVSEETQEAQDLVAAVRDILSGAHDFAVDADAPLLAEEDAPPADEGEAF